MNNFWLFIFLLRVAALWTQLSRCDVVVVRLILCFSFIICLYWIHYWFVRNSIVIIYFRLGFWCAIPFLPYSIKRINSKRKIKKKTQNENDEEQKKNRCPTVYDSDSSFFILYILYVRALFLYLSLSTFMSGFVCQKCIKVARVRIGWITDWIIVALKSHIISEYQCTVVEKTKDGAMKGKGRTDFNLIIVIITKHKNNQHKHTQRERTRI